MPILHSAAKRMRADQKRRQQNLQVKSELRSLIRKFRELLRAGQKEQSQGTLALLIKRLDQAASKKIVRRSTANRKKSRFSRQLAKR